MGFAHLYFKMGVQKKPIFDHLWMIKTPFLNLKWGHYLVTTDKVISYELSLPIGIYAKWIGIYVLSG